MFFQYGTAITKKPLFDIAIAKASVNSTIDNIQFPLFLGIVNANAQSEWNLIEVFANNTTLAMLTYLASLKGSFTPRESENEREFFNVWKCFFDLFRFHFRLVWTGLSSYA